MFKMFLAIFTSILLISCNLDIPSEINSGKIAVPIADQNLANAINLQLGKSSGSTIYLDEVSRLKKLEAPGKNISDLTGIKYFSNLSKLNLADNRISNLDQLAGLVMLDTVNLIKNQIVDIQPLANLKKMRLLILTNNRISSIESLKNLTALQKLFLDYNKISSIRDLRYNCEQSGLSSGDFINLKFNRLDSNSQNVYDLNIIKNTYFVTVEHDELKK